MSNSNLLPTLVTSHVFALVAAAGQRAQTRFWEFFVSNIRNPHTRRAYGRSIAEFLAWCERPPCRLTYGREHRRAFRLVFWLPFSFLKSVETS